MRDILWLGSPHSDIYGVIRGHSSIMPSAKGEGGGRSDYVVCRMITLDKKGAKKDRTIFKKPLKSVCRPYKNIFQYKY